MTLWVCLSCTTKYAVGLFRCPRCTGTDFVEDGQPMPKNTRATGASNAITDTVEEVQEWPGSSSSTSSPTPETKRSRSAAGRRKPAPTTGSPSEPDQTESSTAPSTDGAQAEATSETASDAGE